MIGAVDKVLQPDVLQHDVHVRAGGARTHLRVAPCETRARCELRQRRAATLRLRGIDDCDVNLLTGRMQCAHQQIDVASEADAIRFADDVDAKRAPDR